jgi:ribonuclease G
VKKFFLHIHPYVAAYVEQGMFSLKYKWKKKYGVGMKIIPDQSLGFLQYVFYDKDKNEIDLKEEIEMK